ncbi:MAG: class I lanthipeptide [Spirosomataceae bacterium]
MKKQISKLSLKTDKVVSLSKLEATAIVGGAKPQTKWSNCATCEGGGSAPCCTWNC